jgi:hypothetical protein
MMPSNLLKAPKAAVIYMSSLFERSKAQTPFLATSRAMSTSKLFEPIRVGDLPLQNRVVLAPLTRVRADAKHVPLPNVKLYYAQRASAPGTLLISEATYIAARAGGYPNPPGIWSDEQIKAWKEVRSELCQLSSWRNGEISDKVFPTMTNR